MKRIIEKLSCAAILAVAFMLCASSAGARTILLNYMNFDTFDESSSDVSNRGVVLQKNGGSIDPVKIDDGYKNFAAGKFGAYAYQANNGTIGLRDNTSGLVSVADGWTLSFWFHPNNQSNWNSFFGFGLFNGDNYHFLKTDTDAFSVYKDTTSTDESALGTPALGNVAYTAASWNHIVLACAAGTGTVTLYVNGVSRGTFTVDSTTSLREVLLCRGRWHSGSSSEFYRNKQTTWFDDFALFGGALTPSAVKAIAMGADTVLGLYNAGELNFSRSINVNFYYLYNGSTPYTAVSLANNGTATVNSSSEGYGQYAVEGTYWSDVLATSTAAQSVKVFDGSATSDSTVTATVSGANGGGFTQSGFDHHLMSGYIGDSSSQLEPTVTFANIPFANYRVVLYFAVSGGSASKKYGYVTLNDTINVAGNGSTTIYGDGGATGWGGAAVASNSKNNILLGQNTLVSPVIVNNASGTLKVKSHALYSGNTATYYAGLAAIQIVEATPNATTGTYTFSPAADTTTAITSSSNWDNLPTGKGEDITISISGDATVNVDRDMAFGTITIASTSESAATLTFTGSSIINATQVNVPADVTVKYASSVSGGAPIINAPVVLNNATAALEIAAPATMANAISGSGKVVVSANAVTFATANTFSGGLVVKSGGLAKASVQCGFGGTGTNPQAGTITVENGGTVDVAKCYSTCVYSLTIEGDGVDNQGAVICSSTIGETERQITGITLTGNASISCANNWGLIASEYTATTLSLGSYTLEKKGSATFWLTRTTVSGTGTLDIKEGRLATGGATSGTYNTRGNWTYTSNSSAPIVIRNGAALTVNNASLRADSLTLDSGSSMSVGGGAYALVNNSGTLTANGSVSVAGTLYIGWSGNASFVVGSDVEVTGTGLIHLMSTATITKQGSGTITIGPNATVRWIDCAWTSTAGDIFRGEGTLNLDGNYTHTFSNSGFTGKLKATHSGNFIFNNYPAFTGRPELICDCSEDNKGFVLSEGYAGNALNVRNLNGGLSYFTYSYGTATDTRVVDTLQTRDTTFSGKFISDGNSFNSGKRRTGLAVRGAEETGVHSLELTKASTTFGELTIASFGKVVFAAEGSWANGTVTVSNGGYLEVNNTSSVASTLDLQSGGTIKIATATTTVNDEEVTTVVGITAGAVTFPDSDEAVIDISDIPDLATDAEVTIITASTSLDDDIANLRLIGKPYSLKVDGGALKVVNDGGLVWDSANDWNGKDVTKYGEATITSPGTVALDGTNLAFDTLTLTGSGTVSFSQTGDETIAANNIDIGSGVTLDMSAALNISSGATISGEGTLNIPDGVTLTLDGVTCSAKITAQNGGTLITKGTTTLSNTNNNFAYGSLINVATGKATVNAYKGSGYTTNDRGFHGDITIAEDATFVNSKTESFDCNADSSHPIVVDVYGTLSMGSTRWTLGNYNTIKLHEDATITGTGDSESNGAFDVENNVTTARIVAEGNATIPANIRIRSKMLVEVSDGKNLTFSGSMIRHSDNSIMEVISGQVTSITEPGFKVQIDSDAVFTLYDVVWANGDRFSGLGTLELLSTTATRTHTATGSTFAGIVKLSNSDSKQCNLDPSSAAMFTARPELIANASSIHLGNGWLNNLEHPLQVKNLSGSGQLRAQWTSGNFNYLVDTVQERDTDYTGTISCDVSSGNRYVSFLVKGNNSSEIHSLGITQAQNTSNNSGCKASTLTVSDYGKVVFKIAGGWGYGTVIVGNNGYLQSDSTAATVAGTLTLQDGATVVCGSQPVKATTLTALDANATIKIAFADGVTPADGMVVLSGTWRTPPDAARFAFADSTLAGKWKLTMSANGLSLKKYTGFMMMAY